MGYDILIVDDSATTRAMIKRVIAVSGVATKTVLEAADGIEALEILDACIVDLVLADLHMPRMGGIELTGHIKNDPRLRDIPVVIVSADPNANRIEELKRQGVRGYVPKPFTPEAVRTALMGILNAAAEATHA